MVEAAMKMNIGSATIGLFSLLLTGVLIIPHTSYAKDLTLTREVYLEKGQAIQPNVIVRTHDNGFVIAGVMTGLKQAWATRTDADGNVKWRYTAVSPDKSMYAQDPTYNGAAVMPDDSVFLCGYMTGQNGGALLTHIDKDGNVLSEQLFHPQIDGNKLGGSFNACLLLDERLVIVGSTAYVQKVEPSASHPLPYNQKDFYWLLSIGKAGKVDWEKFIPRDKWARTLELSFTHAPDGGFIFGSDPNASETELFHISSSGDIVARNVFKGGFRIVQSEKPDGILQLIPPGTQFEKGPPTFESGALPVTLLTLNDRLEETGRISELHDSMTIREAYRSPDRSLVLFGSLWEAGHSSFARVTWLDPTLKHEQVLALTKAPESSFWVNAAVPLDRPGEFVCVRAAFNSNNSGAATTEEALAKDRLGIALDFVALKPSN
jgi:hypothetical protein